MTDDLARERRIRENLAELRRLLAEDPTRAGRFYAWLAEQEGDEMNEKAITLRLPADLLEQADALVPTIQAHGDFQAVRVTRSTVIRLAMMRGIAALTEEFGEPAPAPKSKRRRGPAKGKGK